MSLCPPLALDAYTELLKPALLTGVLKENWETPAQIKADTLSAYYGYAVLYLGNNSTGWEGSKEIPLADVATGLSKHFEGVTEAQLKSATGYNATKNTIAFASGFGGAVSPKVTKATVVGDAIQLDYDTMVGNEKNGAGSVLVLQQGNQLQYLSNQYKATV